jgi:predicted nucleic acid-binding protein
LAQQSSECGKLLRRCAEGKVEGYVSLLSLTEVAHRLMILEARENGWIKGSNPVRSLQLRPDRVRALIHCDERLQDILRLRLHVEDFKQPDFIEALRIRRRYGLLTNDSILLAVALRLGIKDIASADKALRAVPGYFIHRPSDIG